MVIQFLPECLGTEFLNAPEARKIRDLYARARRGLLIRGKARRAISERLLQMLTEPVGSLQHLSGFLWIMSTLAESRELTPMAVSERVALSSDAMGDRVNAVLTLINERLPDVPAQSEVAARLRLSPQAFSRFFRRCLGKSYIQYVNELRIGQVCRALLQSEQSVTAIAYAAGFTNLSNFNEQVRKLKGITPREYRRLGRLPGSSQTRGADEPPAHVRLPQNSFAGSVRNAKEMPPCFKLN
jgi:AraC-like DNA-binding protein